MSDPNQPRQKHDPPPAFSPGEIVSDRFRIVALLGRGGMGEVYEAEDLVVPGERVALKALPSVDASDEGAVERLKREMAIARRVTHPNVCRVFDVDQHRSPSGARVTFFTMELLKGETLTVRLRHGHRLSPPDALPLIGQMAAALSAAHAVGIVHGDFKPGNVMVVPRSGGERAVVTDFGLAHRAHSGTTTTTEPTLGIAGWGTPAYMAPEQVARGTVSPRTDVYAMGVVIHQMIAGRLPFDVGPLDSARGRPLGSARDRQPVAIDPRWRAAIDTCLARDPAARFATPDELVRALEAPERPAPNRRRYVGIAAAAAAMAIAAVLVFIPSIRTAIVSRVAPLGSIVGPARQSVAFLPFVDSTVTQEAAAFGDGLATVLTEQLRLASERQHLEGRVWMLPAAEVLDANINDASRARRTLGVNLIVAGRIDRDDTRIRIAFDLEEAEGERSRTTARDAIDVANGRATLLAAATARVAKMIGLPLPAATAQEVAAGSTTAPEAEAWYVRGRGYLARGAGTIDAALDALGRAVETDRSYALAHAALGEAYRQKYLATRDPMFLMRAQASGDRAAALVPSLAYGHAVRGLVYQSTGQDERATRELQAALEIDPGAVEARRALAEVLEADGARDKAEAIYRQQIAQYPGYWNAYEQLGSFLFRHGRYAEAETHFLNGVQYAPDNVRAISNLAALYALTERYAAAQTELERGVELSPDVLFLNNLSFVHVFQGRLAEAIPPMEQAVKLSGADSLHWGNLARVYRWANRRDQAKATYETALRLARQEVGVNPRNVLIRANLARLLAETGQRGEALAEMSSALERAPTNTTVVFASAVVYELTGDRDAALKALETAARSGHSVGELRRFPDLAALRTDPRFLQVLNAIPKSAVQ